MEDNDTFPLLAGLALIISSVERITEHIADTTEHVAAIAQIPGGRPLLDPSSPPQRDHRLDPSAPFLGRSAYPAA